MEEALETVVSENSSLSVFTDNFTNVTTFNEPSQNGSSELWFKDYPTAALKTAFVFIIFAVFGVFANAVSMLALGRASMLHNATTALLANLCFSDLLFSAANTPLAATVFWYGDWVYPQHICVAHAASLFFNVGSSIFTVIAIAINRLVIITKPKRYKRIFTPGNNLLVIASTWVATAALVMLPAGRLWGRLTWDAETGTCGVVAHNGRNSKVFLFMMAYFLPTAIFVVCYSRIYWVVRRTQRNLRQYSSGRRTSTAFIANLTRRVGEDLTDQHVQRYTRRTDKDMRLLRMLLVIFLTFTVCYLPMLFLKGFRLWYDSPGVQVFASITFHFSGCVNPIIYICMSREYRKAYRELWSRRLDATMSDSGGSRGTTV